MQKFWKSLLWALALSAAPLGAQEAPEEAPRELNDGQVHATVVELLESEGAFTTFLDLLERAELLERLREADAITVLAPSDAAFAAVPEDIRESFLDDAQPEELRRLMLHHLIEGRLALMDLGRQVRRPSMMGDQLALRQLSDGRYAIDAGILARVDLAARNGYVHELEEPLLPASLRQQVERRLFGTGRHVYAVDIDHSSVMFRAVHAGFGAVWGWFREFEGELTVDSEHPEKSSIRIDAKVSSIDTNNEARDDYLQTADFFDAANAPLLSFRSERVEPIADSEDLQVSGTLSLRGMTREVSFRALKIGEGRFGPGHYKIGYETAFQIRRSEFGMGFGIPGVASDEVTLTIALEGIRSL